MKIRTVAAVILLALPAAGQGGPGECCMGRMSSDGLAPIASNPVVELSGTVAEVHIAAGQGMPYIQVKQEGGTVRLYLGAMHYLLAQNFNPKTGQQVTAKGYKTSDGVIGIQVSLPGEKKSLKLRDEKGWPVWRGGFGGGWHGGSAPPTR